ncbi:MAG: PQQ-dependent sugar dehydrogenase [Proteobacteria bacterium]|nr:PQQ-dependent sugar dehydrogenase [Pseudomonadota bacterium]
MTPDNLLWIATGDNAPAQDPMSLGGKVMRLKDDGSVPADNPFVGKAGYRPEIYTMGHRSSMGLAVHPVSGAVYLSEMGPNGATRSTCSSPAATTAGRW